MVLDIAIAVVAVLAVVASALVVVARRRPERLMPLMRLLMRSKKVRETAGRQMASEFAADPQMFEEAMSSQVGRSHARQAAKVLGSRSEAERQELLESLFQKAEAGDQITPEDLARKRPRTAEEARARAKKKDQARARRKAAKGQKRR